jgi:multidrug efflux pump subunit AcrA (membrane-fusion protein)
VLKSSTSTTSATSFPVTIALDPADSTLYSGSGATVSITIGKVDNVLTVPSSAVHTEGSGKSVTVVQNGAQSTVAVTVGAVGTNLTEISSGLTEGQEVVLADLTAALPTSTASTRTAAGLGGAGGFGGAGARAGFGGGGVPAGPVGGGAPPAGG